jgi:predicted  nucleic acid-binding Zn-ribbon protein
MNEPEREHHQIGVYNRMMERVKHALDEAEHMARPNLEHAIQRARERTVELGEATREEAAKLAAYLRRDLREMTSYLSDTGKDYDDWFYMDLKLIEARLLDLITSVADKTKLELALWAEQVEQTSNYRSGEITGPGTLECIACGQRLTHVKAAHIPPCPRCGASEFRRITG